MSKFNTVYNNIFEGLKKKGIESYREPKKTKEEEREEKEQADIKLKNNKPTRFNNKYSY